MPLRLKLFILIACVLAAAKGTLYAQSSNGAITVPDAEFGIWGGGAVHTARIASRLRDATLGMVGLTYAKTLMRTRVAALQYTFDLVPAAVLHYPETGRSSFAATYAGGFSPLGVRLNFRPHHRFQPFAGLRGGCLYFADKIPGASGARFNFTMDLNGFRIVSRSGKALSLGYMLHHTSNADRATANPGLDSGIIYVGYSFFR